MMSRNSARAGRENLWQYQQCVASVYPLAPRPQALCLPSPSWRCSGRALFRGNLFIAELHGLRATRPAKHAGATAYRSWRLARCVFAPRAGEIEPACLPCPPRPQRPQRPQRPAQHAGATGYHSCRLARGVCAPHAGEIALHRAIAAAVSASFQCIYINNSLSQIKEQ